MSKILAERKHKCIQNYVAVTKPTSPPVFDGADHEFLAVQPTPFRLSRNIPIKQTASRGFKKFFFIYQNYPLFVSDDAKHEKILSLIFNPFRHLRRTHQNRCGVLQNFATSTKPVIYWTIFHLFTKYAIRGSCRGYGS